MPELNTSTPDGDDVLFKPDEIQFDQAEYATPVPGGPVCSACNRPILDSYYEINGNVVCASCRQGIEASFRGGSRLARALRAMVFGSLAAMVGAVLYYAFVRLTNINFGLVAVVLGLMVGGAVRRGSGNRGGRFYQFLAVFLTYAAIAGMMAPAVIEGFRKALLRKPHADAVAKHLEKPAAKAAALPKARVVIKDAPAPPLVDIPANPFADAPAEVVTEKVTVPKDAEARNIERAPEPELTAMTVALLVAFVAFIFWASPVLEAFQAPISGLIYCFALWEAWKMNKAVQLVFNGPFRVSAQGPVEQEPEVDGNDG